MALTLLALPIALPVLLVLALAIFIDSPGPVFYRSRRIGHRGVAFDMLKLRTMAADVGGPGVAGRQDPRHTPLGRRLSASRLNELPQLWNVLKGDMSLVGPRPELPQFVAAFPEEYEVITSVRPGLTGPAQLTFVREGWLFGAAHEHERETMYREHLLPDKVAIDMTYARRGPSASDLRYLILTALLPAWHALQFVAATLERAAAQPRTLHAARALVLGMVALMGLFAAEAAVPF